MILQRDEQSEQTDGGIYIAEVAKRIPVSGIVVKAADGLQDLMGVRVYFRAHTDNTFPLGPDGDGPEACFIHRGDIIYVEEV